MKKFTKVFALVFAVLALSLSMWRIPAGTASAMTLEEVVAEVPEETIPQETAPVEEPTIPTPAQPTAPAPAPVIRHTHTAVTESKAATCTEDGYTVTSCATCGDILDSKTYPALGHDEVVLPEVKATCVEDGLTEGKDCVRCNRTLIEQRVVFAFGHTIVVDAAVESTCTNTGLTEGTHCSVCNSVLVAQEIIPATGHDYETHATEPNCIDAGITTTTCKNCGDSSSTVEANLGHIVITDAAVEATCTENGLTEGSHCDRCHVILVPQKVINAYGHDYQESAFVAPQIGVDGYREFTCTVCGDSYRTPLAALEAPKHNHSTITSDVEATCTTDGAHSVHCEDCGELLENVVIPAFGHNYQETARVEPAINVEGYVEFTCQNCGDNYRNVLDALEAPAHTHDWEINRVEATCTTNGVITESCDCGEMTETVIPSIGHNYQETANVAADIGIDGYVEYTCANCGDIYRDIIPALAKPEHTHNLVTETTNPTCTAAGCAITRCADCGEVIEESHIDAVGHNYVVSAHVDAQIGVDGYTEYTCNNCGDFYRETIPALEAPAHTHNWETTSVNATCTTNGYSETRCSCGEVAESSSTPAHGHNYALTNYVAPQINVEGEEEFTCSHCGAKYYNVIDALPPNDVHFTDYDF